MDSKETSSSTTSNTAAETVAAATVAAVSSSAAAAPATKTLDDLFPADKDLIDDGVVFELAGGTALKVRRIDNRQFQGFVETVQKANRFQFDHELLGEEEKTKLMIPGIARHLLVGWENFPPEKPVSYSVEAAVSFLTERRSMLRAVLNMASQTRAYVNKREEATAKN